MVDLSEELRDRLDSSADDRPIIGLEHEFAIFDNGCQLDFSGLLHRLGVTGVAVHPINPDVYLTESGIAISSDGLVAEVATPPLAVAPGVPQAVNDWANAGRAVLADLLPEGLSLSGGSTHLSVSVDPSINDRLAMTYARTFAPAMMLLMDGPASPGLLIRPRPGRLELGGEYITGHQLQAAVVFAIASVMTLERYLLNGRGRTPPAVIVKLEAGRRRYGWYVDRRAFGVDLYKQARATPLRLSSGNTISAQQHLARSWRLARRCVERDGLFSKPELAAVDRVVAGQDPLPLEMPGSPEFSAPSGLPHHPFGDATCTRRRNGFRIAPRTATWDFVAFEAINGEEDCVICVPRRNLAGFLSGLDAGRFDDLLHLAASKPSPRGVLSLATDTAVPGIFASVVEAPALLPNDRPGIGTGVASQTRPGKLDDQEVSLALGMSHRRYWIGGGVLLAITLAILVTALAISSGGGSEPASAVAEPDPQVAVEDESAAAVEEPAVEDQPLTEVQDEPTVAVEEPLAQEEEPVAAVEDDPAIAVDDPVAQVTIVETTLLADPDGDVWIEVGLAAPWPPAADAAWNMILRVGIATGGQFHGTQWSLVDGKTRGEGFMAGDVQAALDGEIYESGGKLVVKPPGLSPTGGLSASDLGPDAEVVLFAQLILEEGDEIQRWEETTPLGEVTQLTEPLPRSDWQREETDFGPVTLVIPGGEGSGA